MDIFEIKDEFEPLSPAEEKAALHQYLINGDEARAAWIISRMGTLDREEGELCLTVALRTCSAELFGKLLGHVPRGEYAGDWSAQFPETPPIHWGIVGTLPTLAAAMDKAEHLRLLLDWGCDVNSASLEAATALENNYVLPPGDINEWPCARGIPTAPQHSGAQWQNGAENQITVRALTPLAAAILLGSGSCVRLLLEREGVWLTETPSVSEALAVRDALPDAEARRTCRRLLLTRTDGLPRPLLLWAAIRRMNAASLRDELRRCAYGRGELIRAALTLADNASLRMAEYTSLRVTERLAMLAVIGERDPEALRDERVRRRIAALVYCDFDGKEDPLPKVVERALGDTVDLDESSVGWANYSAPLAELCLKRFGENRRLVMSRDMVHSPSASPITANYLRVLLRCVEFRAPSLPLGVSALTAAILGCGDVRLLRSALKSGLIPAEEPIERLLELAGKSTAARSLLLTHPRPSVPCAPAGAESDSCRVLSKEEEERVLADPALRAMASDALLYELTNSDRRRGNEPLRWEGLETINYDALCALRGETDIVLRCAMRRVEGAERANMVLVNRVGMSEQMYLTLLCCAAVGGQTETVRALLRAGFDPEERDMGRSSSLWLMNEQAESLNLSPLLCALLWERWDTAALLLERGAWCDLTCRTVRRVFETVRGGVPYGDIRRELGAYLEGGRLETICVLRSFRGFDVHCPRRR